MVKIKREDFRPELERKGIASVYTVRSETEPERVHIIAFLLFENRAICSCKGFTYNKYCWHTEQLEDDYEGG